MKIIIAVLAFVFGFAVTSPALIRTASSSVQQPVECVMALFASSNLTISERNRRAEGEATRSIHDPNPITAAQLRALPVLQQAALLTMRESQVRRAVVARLLTDCQDQPSHADYHALVERGFAIKNPADQWHKPTASGRYAAGLLEQALCAHFGIHHLIDFGGGGYEVHFRCVCGQWSSSIRKGDYTNKNAAGAFRRHVTAAMQTRRLFDALAPEGM